MALHTQLPIYKVAYDLLDAITDLSKNMPMVVDMEASRDYLGCVVAHQRCEIGVSEYRRTSRQQCGFFNVRQQGIASYGRGLRGGETLAGSCIRYANLQVSAHPDWRQVVRIYPAQHRSRVMAYNKLTIEQKLLAKAKWEGDCLIWFGDKDSNGYGRIRYNGKKVYAAHRLVYELANGSIPDGQVVRHKCDNMACINIQHLELGTQKQNVHDMLERGRANHAKGESHGRAKLTRAQVEEIRNRHIPRKHGCGCRALAREYQVSPSTVVDIINRTHWK